MQPIQYDRNWRRSTGAEVEKPLPCMRPGAAYMWDQDAGRLLNLIARETCATVCPFRVDCYMTSYMSGDNGVIRGGIMLQGRVRTTNCVRCGLPAIKVSKNHTRKLCAVCICLWDCYGCGRKFWVDRSHEPKSWRQYHSVECQIASLKDRIVATRGRRVVAHERQPTVPVPDVHLALAA